MKVAKFIGFNPSGFASQNFALLERVADGFKVVVPFLSCRTWMSDALYDLKNKTNKACYPIESTTWDYTKGNTYIGITFLDENMKKVFLNQLKSLHIKEGQAKVRKTKIIETDVPLRLIIEGSKYWKDSVWKIQLYTMYLRDMCYLQDYHYRYLWNRMNREVNEPIMLSKLKIKKEVNTSVQSIHVDTGPYAICIGNNPHMAKLLRVQVK